MYGALLTDPCDPAADYGLIFMNTQQYTTMCGHAVIGAATTIIETGMVSAAPLAGAGGQISLTFDTPVGLVRTQSRVQDGQVREVSFWNAPVFAYQLDAMLSVPELGQVPVDIVYSGGFFALLDAGYTGLELEPRNSEALAQLGLELRRAAASQLQVQHPELAYLTVVDAVEFHEPAVSRADGSLYARNVATFGERTIDRSPCGTGTCARMAALYARGELAIGQRFISESIIGTRFVGRIVDETQVGSFQAIVPEVSGRAYLTGFHQFVLDPDDPFSSGFSLYSTEFQRGSCL